MAKIFRYEANEKLVGIIVLEATLTNMSPLQIGSGRDDISDKEIIRKPNVKPYIPATALAGKLLRLFKKHQTEITENSEEFKQFWGGDFEKNIFQSHISFDDADCIEENHHAVIRDGVQIVPKTNLAAHEGKFDYEVLEPNHSFKFKAEIKVRQGFEKEKFKKMACFMKVLLKSFQIGASEKSGFGLMESTDAQAYYFDFEDGLDANLWFEYLENDGAEKYKNLKLLAVNEQIEYINTKLFTLNATFQLKSTLLTATYGVEKNEPDKTQLSRNNGSNKEYILSGAAIRGALHHRALRILKIQGDKQPEHTINQLFGFVDKSLKIAKKSKLRVSESGFSKNMTMKQTRIKIDRFTGGTIEGALLESQAITCSEGQEIELIFSIPDFKKNEVELILYLLKDLWNEDLPIGGDKNIGRGLLKGIKANFTFFDKITEEVEINNDGISKKNLEVLNKYLA